MPDLEHESNPADNNNPQRMSASEIAMIVLSAAAVLLVLAVPLYYEYLAPEPRLEIVAVPLHREVRQLKYVFVLPIEVTNASAAAVRGVKVTVAQVGVSGDTVENELYVDVLPARSHAMRYVALKRDPARIPVKVQVRGYRLP